MDQTLQAGECAGPTVIFPMRGGEPLLQPGVIEFNLQLNEPKIKIIHHAIEIKGRRTEFHLENVIGGEDNCAGGRLRAGGQPGKAKDEDNFD